MPEKSTVRVLSTRCFSTCNKETSFFLCFLFPFLCQGLLLAASVSGVLFPGRKTKGAIASVFFWIPLLGNLLTWFGCVPADSGNISALLRSDNLVFLLPEGIAGVFQTSWQQ